MNPDGMVALLNYRVCPYCPVFLSINLLYNILLVGGWCYPCVVRTYFY